MFREKTLLEIYAMRQYYNKHIKGRTASTVYRQLAKRYKESLRTISGKVQLNGMYRVYREDIERMEKPH